MVDPRELTGLETTTREDVLSVSLDTDPTKPEHQTPTPAYRVWLHQAVRRALDGVPGPARDAAEQTARHVLAHVDAAPARGRGLAIFAAPDLWREYVLPFPLPNGVQYGRADLTPMLWALREYQPYAIVAVYREHARIAVAYLGRTAVVDEQTLELDTDSWQFKSGRPDTHTRAVNIGVGRGVQTDAFDARVGDHVRRFWQRVAEAVGPACAARGIDHVILGGSPEAAAAVRELLPDQVRAQVIGSAPIPPYATVAEIGERTLPLALAHYHESEANRVTDVLAGVEAGGSGVTGRPATLEALLAGQLRVLVASRDVEGDVWACRRCGYVSPGPVAACPACGEPVIRAPLRPLLPLLARRHGAALEVVGPAEGSRLTDRIGGLRRYRPAPPA